MAKIKSKVLLWFQIAIAIIVIAWLSYDFYFTLIDGVTYKVRLNDTLDIREHPLVFIITIALKLLVYGFFIWLFHDCYQSLKIVKK